MSIRSEDARDDGRPWAALYPPGEVDAVRSPWPDLLSLFESTVERAGAAPMVRYLGSTLTVSDVDRMSGALATALAAGGVGFGDRVAVILQNTPAFVLATLATWKLGAIVVPVNPMLKAEELGAILADSGSATVIAHPASCQTVADALVAGDGTGRPRVILSRCADYGERPLPDVFDPGTEDVPPGVPVEWLVTLVAGHDGEAPARPSLSPDHPALLTYTSGTTGPSKGAINTHGNVVFNVESCWRFIGLENSDVVLAVAPMFHITGSIVHLGLSLRGPLPLVLTYRFDAPTMLATIAEERPTFAIGAITAFIALLSAVRDDPDGRDKCSSLTKVCSGGAPVPASVVQQFSAEIGPYIRNMYGLTETTSAITGVPMGRTAPIDVTSGALSVGVPTYSTDVRIVDDDDAVLGAREVGELAVVGPQVVPGYWNRPEETAHALRGGYLHTGDVGFMDEDGWVYIVDRKKDMIIASGYKVWPREVEDILYRHHAVQEAGVVGAPDDYRGETVVAYVSLVPGREASATELMDHCRQHLAAYKVPRQVHLVTELPKTATGKILRRSLRA